MNISFHVLLCCFPCLYVFYHNYIQTDSQQKNGTFNLPDFTDNKVPLGVGSINNVGRYNAGEVPNIKGYLHATERSQTADIAGGSFNATQDWYWAFGGGTNGINDIIYDIDASRSSTVYKNNISRVIAHGIMMLYCIRY